MSKGHQCLYSRIIPNDESKEEGGVSPESNDKKGKNLKKYKQLK